ncbi:mRNA-degrading endonuclease toxin of MazEF toxin-antitoxin module [Halarchaeum solikamskense]|uniref:type II toxin-antitoxin system PemK/MazF family toxin n=1 Tax=Halarchaeum nitratireducens TaxID=489913 RepID=UPI001B3AD7E3|nr:mRNA-degrading endonuclease toxin of MazEF toxin-antitoxin module [Halarchaeum solikamskense]
MSDPSRGDIARVSFTPKDESPDGEFEDPHPALILQRDRLNNELDSTVVIPVTSSYTRVDRARNVELKPGTDGVEKNSIAVLPLVTTVSIPERIHDHGAGEGAWKMGEISNSKLSDIERKLNIILGLK